MPEYLAPGVYVEEIDTGSKPIEGVSTSTAGMIGVTERGPVNVPILLTSLGDYTRWFGERLSFTDFPGHCYTPLAVEGFFTNGGKRLYLTRILDTAGATSAAGELYDHGTPTGADTMILRSAGELSGTLAPGPLVYALDTSALNVGDSIRIGDGSRSEYRLVAAAPDVTNNKHVPLSFPLSISHAGGDPGGRVRGGSRCSLYGAVCACSAIRARRHCHRNHWRRCRHRHSGRLSIHPSRNRRRGSR